MRKRLFGLTGLALTALLGAACVGEADAGVVEEKTGYAKLADTAGSCYGNPGISGAPYLCLEQQQYGSEPPVFRVCSPGQTYSGQWEVTYSTDRWSSPTFASWQDGTCSPWMSVDLSGLMCNAIHSIRAQVRLPNGQVGLTGEVRLQKGC